MSTQTDKQQKNQEAQQIQICAPQEIEAQFQNIANLIGSLDISEGDYNALMDALELGADMTDSLVESMRAERDGAISDFIKLDDAVKNFYKTDDERVRQVHEAGVEWGFFTGSEDAFDAIADSPEDYAYLFEDHFLEKLAETLSLLTGEEISVSACFILAKALRDEKDLPNNAAAQGILREVLRHVEGRDDDNE